MKYFFYLSLIAATYYPLQFGTHDGTATSSAKTANLPKLSRNRNLLCLHNAVDAYSSSESLFFFSMMRHLRREKRKKGFCRQPFSCNGLMLGALPVSSSAPFSGGACLGQTQFFLLLSGLSWPMRCGGYAYSIIPRRLHRS